MSKQLPEYERRQAITPQTQLSGAQSGFNQAAESVTREGLGNQLGAQLGKKIAQDSANYQAQLSGIEAATNPGQTFIPIGESGHHFVNAYKKAELQNVDFEATTALQNIYSMAASERNPTDQTLMDFQQNAIQGIDKAAGSVSRENQNALRQSLMETYQSGFAKLSHKVEQANYERLVSQNNVTYQQKVDLMNESALGGNRTDALRYAEEAKSIITSGLTLGVLKPEEAEKRLRQMQFTLNTSIYNGGALQAARENRGPQYLEELVRGDTVAHLKPSERLEVIHSVRGTLGEYDAALSSSRYIQYADAIQEARQGTLTPAKAEEYYQKLGPQLTADLSSKIAEIQEKHDKENRLVSGMTANFQNPMAMAQYTDKEVRAVTERMIAQRTQELAPEGGRLPLQQQAELVETIMAPNSVICDQINAMMGSMDPRAIAEAAPVFVSLESKNPLSVSKVDSKSADLARSISDAVMNGTPIEQAIALKTQNILGATPADIEFREKQFKSGEDFKSIRNPSDWKSNASKALGFSKSDIPDGLAKEFYNAVGSAYIRDGNKDDAIRSAASVLKRTWGETHINGDREVMYSAPDLWMPGGDAHVKKQLSTLSMDISKKSKELYDANERDWYYEVSEEAESTPSKLPRTIDEFGSLFKSQKLIPIRQVFRDEKIKSKEGHLIIQSDQYTSRPESGSMPSYFLAIRGKEGRFTPVYNPESAQIQRYQLSANEYQEEQKANRQKSVESAKNRTELTNQAREYLKDFQ